jgi:hypothetical protein
MPLAPLSASERERRRIERDKILDLLEQEESVQHAANEETEQTQRHETSQKRKEDAQSEMEKSKVAREMQKKMGKALLRNMAEAREKEEKAQKEALLQDGITEEQKTTLKPKKSVSFAELPPGGGESETRTKFRKKEVQFDWGDVAPAKLRSANRSALMTKTQMNRHPMKLDVVERLPTVQSEHEEPIIQIQDSDDESVHSSPVSADSDENDDIQSRKIGSLDPEVADPGSGEDDPEDGLLSEDDEFDLDTARHHREIALAYYEKRNAIGQRAAAAINTGEDEWNQPVCVADFALLCERSSHHYLIGSASGRHAIILPTQTHRVSLQGRSYYFFIQGILSIYFHFSWNVRSSGFGLPNFETRHSNWPPGR